MRLHQYPEDSPRGRRLWERFFEETDPDAVDRLLADFDVLADEWRRLDSETVAPGE